jgi:hypothetical protein
MSIQYPAGSRVMDAIVFNPLWLPGHEPHFMNYVIAGGQTLLAGSVLGRVTATGKLKLSAASAADGSETPMAVLAHDVASYDAVSGAAKDVNASVIVAEAYINETALHWGADHTLTSVKEALRPLGILLRAPGYSG